MAMSYFSKLLNLPTIGLVRISVNFLYFSELLSATLREKVRVTASTHYEYNPADNSDCKFVWRAALKHDKANGNITVVTFHFENVCTIVVRYKYNT